MIQSWFLLILFSLAVFRLTRLVVFDTITAPLRSLFHEEVEEKMKQDRLKHILSLKEKA
ncbi:DUF1360 domain-containing protein [Bacillus sonorensis]|nr:DUF1360 domain-containing protein [Bacillus sonorensis]